MRHGTQRARRRWGGDVDTMAAMAGGIAEAYFGGVPEGLTTKAIGHLTDDFQDVVNRFRAAFVAGRPGGS